MGEVNVFELPTLTQRGQTVWLKNNSPTLQTVRAYKLILLSFKGPVSEIRLPPVVRKHTANI